MFVSALRSFSVSFLFLSLRFSLSIISTSAHTRYTIYRLSRMETSHCTSKTVTFRDLNLNHFNCYSHALTTEKSRSTSSQCSTKCHAASLKICYFLKESLNIFFNKACMFFIRFYECFPNPSEISDSLTLSCEGPP